MRRSTRVLLLVGCAVVLFMGAPLTFSTLASDLRGPYAAGRTAASAEAAPLPAAGPARSFLRRDLERR